MRKTPKEKAPLVLWTWQRNLASELKRCGNVILYATRPANAPSPCRVQILSPPPKPRRKGK